MRNTKSRIVFAALMMGAASAFAADRMTITVVNPQDNSPVANQELRVNPKGLKSRLLRTNHDGRLTLPASFQGKEAAIRCSKVPLIFDTHQRLEPGMTVVLKHSCGGFTNYNR